MDHPPFDHRRVPPSVAQWLLLIVATFVAGCEMIAIVPRRQVLIVDIGVDVNVAMAIGIGVLLAWRGSPQRLFCASALGAVVTVLGWDALTFAQARDPRPRRTRCPSV
jgi:hypothetical protein